MKLPALREIIEERKGKAVETLSESYAKNRLPLEEYERLVEYINKIESERELVVVEKIVAEYGGAETHTPSMSSSDDDDDDPVDSGQYSLPGNLTLLSSRSHGGPLKPGQQFSSILGSWQIKVRAADLKKQRTEIQAFSFLGDCTIFVESGIRVTNNAVPILGSTGVNHKVNKQAQAGAPELVISGAALLGEISVKLLRE